MPPPDLARDAPVLDVPHPLEVSVLPTLWNKLHLAVLHDFDRGLGKRSGLHKPLGRKIRLNNSFAAVALAYGVRMVIGLDHEAPLLEQFDHHTAGLLRRTFPRSA